MRRLLLTLFCLASVSWASAQTRVLDFFRPMYFTAGLPLDEKPSDETADLKFQLSFRLNMFRDIKDSGVDVFVGYTQRSVWNIFANSSPFYDHCFMPGLYCSWPMKSKTGNEFGNLLFGVEHRSNGRDDDFSRSINVAFATYSHYLPHNVILQASLRAGFCYYGDEITMALMNHYLGYVDLSASWTSPQKNWNLSLGVTPIWNKSIANITAEAGWKPGKKGSNPYIFLQYHYGYDDAMRDCRYAGPQEHNADGYVIYNHAASPLPPHHTLCFGILLHPQNCFRGLL